MKIRRLSNITINDFFFDFVDNLVYQLNDHFFIHLSISFDFFAKIPDLHADVLQIIDDFFFLFFSFFALQIYIFFKLVDLVHKLRLDLLFDVVFIVLEYEVEHTISIWISYLS